MILRQTPPQPIKDSGLLVHIVLRGFGLSCIDHNVEDFRLSVNGKGAQACELRIRIFDAGNENRVIGILNSASGSTDHIVLENTTHRTRAGDRVGKIILDGRYVLEEFKVRPARAGALYVKMRISCDH